LLGVASLLFLFILFSRLQDGVFYKRRQQQGRQAQDFITTFLFNAEELSPQSLEDFCRQHLQSTFQRQVFLDSLLQLHRNIIGESSLQLRSLYEQLGLHAFSKSKLYSGAWDVIAKGIGELAEMGMKQDAELIRSFINHPQAMLRSEVQVALLRLQNEAPFAFLDELEEPLMDWQQMQLARAAQKANLTRVPAFRRWLHKRQETIVCFSIRMIVRYGQQDAVRDLLELLSHPSVALRQEVVKALRHLEAYEATEHLLLRYPAETLAVRLEILRTLPVISGEETISFYAGLLQDENRSVRLAATKALVQSGESGKALIRKIKDNLQHALQPLAASALDPRI